MEKGRGEMGWKENEMHLFMTQKEGTCSRLIASCILSKDANGQKQVSLVPAVEYLSVIAWNDACAEPVLIFTCWKCACSL